MYRKRHEVAEREYVEAKLQLHRTSEQKELLSEHLCTIIKEAELRKSKKLAQLWDTLSLGEREQQSGPT